MTSNFYLRFAAMLAIFGMQAAQAEVIRTGDAIITTDNGLRILSAGVVDGSTGGAKVVAPGPEVFEVVNIGQGRFGQGTGTIEVSGPGATMVGKNIVGIGTTGNGTLLINQGGKVISEGGPSPYCNSPCTFTIVANGAGSTGRLTVDGAGSSFQNKDASNTNAAFVVANGNVNGNFGQPGAQTTGYFSVLNGAKANTTWARLATFANTKAIVDIAGAGSEWTVERTNGMNAAINLGVGGYAEMKVRDGATFNAQQMNAGTVAGGYGGLLVSGEGSKVQLSGSDIAGIGGAKLILGLRGAGQVQVDDKAVFSIDSGSGVGGIWVGGIQQQTGSYGGSVSVSGGAKMLLSGTNSSLLVRNDGFVQVTGGSLLDVASTPGSAGRTTIGSDVVGKFSQVGVFGSTFKAGAFLGVDHNGSTGIMNADTTALSAHMILHDDSELYANEIAVGAHGIFGGYGSVYGNVTNYGGTVQVGASPDALVIHGNYAQDGGAIRFEIDPDGAGGFLTSTLVVDNDKDLRITGAKIFLDVVGGVDPLEFQKAGLLDLDTFFRTGDGTDFSKVFSLGDVFRDNQFYIGGYRIAGFDMVTGELFGLAAVPEPSSLLILLLGGGILLGLRYGRVKSGHDHDT